tara:strand:+ start:184471 stop:185298 length:828 start_codon:yes stop_codon:yes gene_type:complete
MRYQFQSNQGQFSWRPRYFTDAIKVLIGLNLLLFIFKSISRGEINLVEIFGLSPETIWPLVWQPFTYMFIHGDFWHVAINMLVLFLFGSELETIWGRQGFIKYYIITGVGSGLIWILFQSFSSSSAYLIGASGAVYGILTAYGLMFPNRIVYIYFLFPVKVKWFVIILGAVAFFSSLGSHSNISHLTHLSGMIIGFTYLRFNRQWKKVVFSMRKQILESKIKREENLQKKNRKLQEDVNQILDRINQVGYDGLSDSEKSRLYAASRDISREKKKD